MRIESLLESHGQFPDTDGYWDFNDLPKTEAQIQRLLPPEGSEWTQASLEALTQLARVQSLLGKMDEAKRALDLVEKLIPTISGSERSRLEVRYALERGRLLCLAMMPARAQAFLQQAFDLAIQSNAVFFAIDAALILSLSQPPKYQNAWLQRALELAQSSRDGQVWLAQLHTMDGWHYFDFRRFDMALESFEKALAQPRFVGDESKVFIIRWCRARALRALGRVQEALEIQKALCKELDVVGKVNGHVFLEIAECLQAEQKHDEARDYFERAHQELSADGWYSDNKSDELLRMKFLAKKKR